MSSLPLSHYVSSSSIIIWPRNRRSPAFVNIDWSNLRDGIWGFAQRGPPLLSYSRSRNQLPLEPVKGTRRINETVNIKSLRVYITHIRSEARFLLAHRYRKLSRLMTTIEREVESGLFGCFGDWSHVNAVLCIISWATRWNIQVDGWCTHREIHQ
jgi:hypothetical protein